MATGRRVAGAGRLDHAHPASPPVFTAGLLNDPACGRSSVPPGQGCSCCPTSCAAWRST